MADSKSADDSKTADNVFPVSRIRTIMKSCSDPEFTQIKADTLHVVARAAELFIQTLAAGSYSRSDKSKKSVDYKCLADFINRDAKYEFLQQIVPKKITVKEYRKIMQKHSNHNSDDSGSSSSSSEESSDEESGSDDEENDDDEKKKKDEVQVIKGSDSESDVQIIDDSSNSSDVKILENGSAKAEELIKKDSSTK